MAPFPIPATIASPFFITAEMLQPPWADPMAVSRFSTYLVGMGLKFGSGPELNKEQHAILNEAVESGAITLDPSVGVLSCAVKSAPAAGKQVGEKINKAASPFIPSKTGYLRRHTTRPLGIAMGKGLSVAESTTGIGRATAHIGNKIKSIGDTPSSRARGALNDIEASLAKREKASAAKVKEVAEISAAHSEQAAAVSEKMLAEKKLKDLKELGEDADPNKLKAVQEIIDKAEHTIKKTKNHITLREKNIESLNTQISEHTSAISELQSKFESNGEHAGAIENPSMVKTDHAAIMEKVNNANKEHLPATMIDETTGELKDRLKAPEAQGAAAQATVAEATVTEATVVEEGAAQATAEKGATQPIVAEPVLEATVAESAAQGAEAEAVASAEAAQKAAAEAQATANSAEQATAEATTAAKKAQEKHENMMSGDKKILELHQQQLDEEISNKTKEIIDNDTSKMSTDSALENATQKHENSKKAFENAQKNWASDEAKELKNATEKHKKIVEDLETLKNEKNLFGSTKPQDVAKQIEALKKEGFNEDNQTLPYTGKVQEEFNKRILEKQQKLKEGIKKAKNDQTKLKKDLDSAKQSHTKRLNSFKQSKDYTVVNDALTSAKAELDKRTVDAKNKEKEQNNEIARVTKTIEQKYKNLKGIQEKKNNLTDDRKLKHDEHIKERGDALTKKEEANEALASAKNKEKEAATAAAAAAAVADKASAINTKMMKEAEATKIQKARQEHIETLKNKIHTKPEVKNINDLRKTLHETLSSDKSSESVKMEARTKFHDAINENLSDSANLNKAQEEKMAESARKMIEEREAFATKQKAKVADKAASLARQDAINDAHKDVKETMLKLELEKAKLNKGEKDTKEIIKLKHQLSDKQSTLKQAHFEQLKATGEKVVTNVEQSSHVALLENESSSKSSNDNDIVNEIENLLAIKYRSDTTAYVARNDELKMLIKQLDPNTHKELIEKVNALLNEKTSQKGGEKRNDQTHDSLKEVASYATTKIKHHNSSLEKTHVVTSSDIPHELTEKLNQLANTALTLTETDILREYTHDGLCYNSKTKECSLPMVKVFEELFHEFHDEKTKQQKRKSEPIHHPGSKLVHKTIRIFETLSTDNSTKEVQETMISIFKHLKEGKTTSSDQDIIELLKKGIRESAEISMKTQHKYQALHEIDIGNHLTPANKEEYFTDLMSIVFTPLCPFLELAKRLHMKKDIEDEYYKIVHTHKSFVLTLVESYFNPGNKYDNRHAVKRHIPIVFKRKHKEFLTKLSSDPDEKELQNKVIESLYREYQTHNKENCNPWVYLTQYIDIYVEDIYHKNKEYHALYANLHTEDAQPPMHHSITLMNKLLHSDGIWTTYLHQIKEFIKSEHIIQKEHFEKEISNYLHGSTKLQSNLTTLENEAVDTFHKDTSIFLEKCISSLELDKVSMSLEHDYAVKLFAKFISYIIVHTDHILDEIILLGKIENKHVESHAFYKKLNAIKEMFGTFIIDLQAFTQTMDYRTELYKKLFLIRNDNTKLQHFITSKQSGGSKQIGGAVSYVEQLNQQLDASNKQLQQIELEEQELRKLRGGLRKKRHFTRKQRGGRLSSTLKQGMVHASTDHEHNNAENNSKTQEGGLEKGSVEHFGKMQQLEGELNTKKYNTYKQMEKTYTQLLQLKNQELEKNTQSCLRQQLMNNKKLNCKNNCLRKLQNTPSNNIKCACKKFPQPFKYEDC